jgi:hypothetical protein
VQTPKLVPAWYTVFCQLSCILRITQYNHAISILDQTNNDKLNYVTVLSKLYVYLHAQRERERERERAKVPREGLRKTARAVVSLTQRMATSASLKSSNIFSSSVVRVLVGSSYNTRTCLVPQFTEYNEQYV